MSGPGWLADAFAAVMLTVAAYCTGRLVMARRLRRPTELDTDGAHIVMGVAMAGMLVSGLRTLPVAGWVGVFAVGAAWFGRQLLRGRRGAAAGPWRCLHAGPHLVECAAMLYMFGILPASVAVRGRVAAMGGMAGSAAESRFSFLTLALALFLLGYVAWLGDRLTVRAPALALLPSRQHPAAPADTAVLAQADAAAPEPAADGYPGAAPRGPLLAPRCAVLCKIAMGITMGYMLILML